MSNESWRPKLHLAAYNGSVSDPNGLNQFRGTYHFFSQYAPSEIFSMRGSTMVLNT